MWCRPDQRLASAEAKKGEAYSYHGARMSDCDSVNQVTCSGGLCSGGDFAVSETGSALLPENYTINEEIGMCAAGGSAGQYMLGMECDDGGRRAVKASRCLCGLIDQDSQDIKA